MTTLEIVSIILAIISTSIAIYQFATINESKKRKNELQYLLAGVNSLALQKQLAWQNQISLMGTLGSNEDWEVAKIKVRARDDLSEVASLTVALEGAIDINNSAISAMMDKYTVMAEKNNNLQNEGMKNPLFNKELEKNEK